MAEKEVRLIDAKFAQHIANVELSKDDAGTVQWVLSHTPTIEAYTEQDVRDAYTDGYSKGMAQGMEKSVKHGEWELHHVGHGHYWECSVCHTNPCIYVTKNTKYCPNCGAKMDGE